MGSKKSPKKLPNHGYVNPMVCPSCLKLWVDNETIRDKEEVVLIFGKKVPARNCPRCIYESGGFLS